MKIRTFLDLVINKRDQLIEDINFLEGKVHLLKMTKEDMIQFYSLETEYFKVQLKEVAYRNDPRMVSYMKDLDKLSETFA